MNAPAAPQELTFTVSPHNRPGNQRWVTFNVWHEHAEAAEMRLRGAPHVNPFPGVDIDAVHRRQQADAVMKLVGDYWDIAWAEGHARRKFDGGLAQKKLDEIRAAVQRLAGVQPVAIPAALPDLCACFPGTCRGGEVIDGNLANGLRCRYPDKEGGAA